jgi:predicted enzyme related to lactoylglutathione lyase
MNGVNYVILHVADVAAAKTFFTEQLGMAVDNEAPGFVQFQAPAGGASFALSAQDPAAPLQDVELWWFVDDVDAEHTRLVERGVSIVQPPKDEPFGRTLAYQGPTGQALFLLQPPAEG